MSTPSGLDYYGGFAAIAPVLRLLSQVESAMYPPDGCLVLILPDHALPGVTQAYGLTVVRAAVEAPMLGIKPMTL